MTWYADLAPCTVFRHCKDLAAVLRAVGWLERGKEYPRGKIDASVFSRLVELTRDPWEPDQFRGKHTCDLCQFVGWRRDRCETIPHDWSHRQFNAESSLRQEMAYDEDVRNQTVQGCRNLFVPATNCVMICPEMITHYINAHWYQPPDAFCRAVMECPDTHSEEYMRRLLASGGQVLVDFGKDDF